MKSLLSNRLSESFLAIRNHPTFKKTIAWSEVANVDRDAIKLGFGELKALLGAIHESFPMDARESLEPLMGKYQTSGNAFPYLWGAIVPTEVDSPSHRTCQLFIYREADFIQIGFCLSFASRAHARTLEVVRKFFSEWTDSSKLTKLASEAGLKTGACEPNTDEYSVSLKLPIVTIDAENFASACARLMTSFLPTYLDLVTLFREHGLFDDGSNTDNLIPAQEASGELAPINPTPSSPHRRYWKISCGQGGKFAGVHKFASRISIGWAGAKDLSKFESKEELERDFDSMQGRPFEAGHAARQCWTFSHEIVIGDIVFGYGAGQVLLIGQVVGPYEFLPASHWAGELASSIDETHRHTFPVKWFGCESVDRTELPAALQKRLSTVQTLFELDESEARVIYAAAELDFLQVGAELGADKHSIPLSVAPEMPKAASKVSAADLSDRYGLGADFFSTIRQRLERKKQIVFQGPPGTGKTLIASALAEWIQPDDTRRRHVQFHPSYSYEDFVEGIRPRIKGAQGGFDLVHGVFKEFCLRALKDPQEKYIFLLDEMNRGNVPQIFGELLSMLEYRGKQMTLPYSKELFLIPENVLLIGTMNTADRSIALMDFAIRRRFEFVAFPPSRQALDNALSKSGCRIEKDRVLKMFDALNAFILEELGKDYQLGHSFWIHDELDEAELHSIWTYSLLPTLQEYFFDKPEKAEGLRFEDFFPMVAGHAAA